MVTKWTFPPRQTDRWTPRLASIPPLATCWCSWAAGGIRVQQHGLLFYRIYHHLKDWGMLEVYLMGVLVAMGDFSFDEIGNLA